MELRKYILKVNIQTKYFRIEYSPFVYTKVIKIIKNVIKLQLTGIHFKVMI